MLIIKGDAVSLFSYCRKLLTAVSAVSIEDLKRVGELYFSKILDPSLVTTAVCCNPSKVKEVKEGLEKYAPCTHTHTHTHLTSTQK